MRRLMLFAVLANLSQFSTAAPLHPVHLSVEYIENPLGIDVKSPRFAWRFESSGRDQTQSAYEILVSDNLADIQIGKGNIWSTGKVLSAANIQVEFKGAELKS